jgi:branched-subunit amino acid transport protein
VKQKQRFLTILPLLVDVAGVAGLVLLLPTLAALFAEPSTINVLIIGGAFVVYCTAVYLIRKLEPAADAERVSRLPAWLTQTLTMRLLAIFFALVLAALLLQQLGYWDSIFVADDRVLGAGESSAFFVYGPGAWIAASLFYVLILSASVRVTIEEMSRNYAALALLGLLGVNGMLLLGTAVLQSTNLFSGWLGMIGAFGLLVLLFAPPRVWYLAKRPSLLAALSYLALLLFCAWQIV